MNRLRVKLAFKMVAKREVLNLIAELVRFGQVSNATIAYLKGHRDFLAPVVPSVEDGCRRLLIFNHQVLVIRKMLHETAWAVNDDYRLLRRVVWVERRLFDSLFFIPPRPKCCEIPELIELLLLTKSLMDQQFAALGNLSRI